VYMSSSIEVEVFRLTKFDTNKCYAFALKSRTLGKYPNEKHYTTNKLEYLGKYVYSERWGYGDCGGGAEIFEGADGKQKKIVYDYEGNTCLKR